MTRFMMKCKSYQSARHAKGAFRTLRLALDLQCFWSGEIVVISGTWIGFGGIGHG